VLCEHAKDGGGTLDDLHPTAVLPLAHPS
jgi:hypothetical protein